MTKSHWHTLFNSISIKHTLSHTHRTHYQAGCCPLITSHLLIGKSVKEIKAVWAAQSGRDASERSCAGTNFIYSHMFWSLGHFAVSLEVEVARLFLHSPSKSENFTWFTVGLIRKKTNTSLDFEEADFLDVIVSWKGPNQSLFVSLWWPEWCV